MFTPRVNAMLQALFVTFIWSLSWVFIKFGLQDIPALVFAGLRYSIAALCLLILLLSRPNARQQVSDLSRGQWLRLTLLGLVFYTVTQGTQFLALVYLPAVTLSLMLNFTVALVALSGLILDEAPTRWQWIGIGVFILGAVIYFGPSEVPAALGLLIGSISVAANAAAAVLGRSLNRNGQLSPLVVTTVSMSLGAFLLLIVGVIFQGVPTLGLQSWGVVVWLALVHTAFAFTLWNRTLRHLQAFESSLINNTMLIQIAILAWLFLGESVSWLGSLGLVCAVVGILVVQFGARPSAE